MKFYDEKSFDGHPPRNARNARVGSRLERFLIRCIAPKLDNGNGTLKLQLPNGNRYRFGTGKPCATIKINHYKCLTRLLTSSSTNSWSESYLEGEWDSPDLCELVRWGIKNEAKLTSPSVLNLWKDSKYNRFHKSRENHRDGSRRNIAAHYDLGNDFYQLWLDPSMTYSSALYTDDTLSLAQAQTAKYQKILNSLKVPVNSNILEIGCGWGGFAELAAQQKHRVHGVTLSERQLEWAQQRISDKNLSQHASFSLTDYRDINAQYDAVVSIEMFEAVGEAHWDSYFEQLKRCLKKEGRAVLQIITIDDKRFETYRKQADFIQRYIFPGGMLPSVKVLKNKLAQHGFELTEQHMFGQDYATTLAEWAQRFEDNFPTIKTLGFDDRFYRMWRYYLAYCEGGFRENAIDVGLFTISNKA